jgi:hypothetical protein
VVFPDVEHVAASSYLRELVASDYSPATIRSYAYALLRWFRFPHEQLNASATQHFTLGELDRRTFPGVHRCAERVAGRAGYEFAAPVRRRGAVSGADPRRAGTPLIPGTSGEHRRV